jgi:7-carboxy-7-deazaguanine synthase
MMINVSEIFRTLQGEGLYTGKPSVFFRVSGCNLRCRWIESDGTERRCDTPYTSFYPERNIKNLKNVIHDIELLLKPHDHLVVTGGEPLLFPGQIEKIVSHFHRDHIVTIETNATAPAAIPGVGLWSMSPKLPSSGNSASLCEIVENAQKLMALNQDADFQIKFVVSSRDDLSVADFVFDQIGSHSRLTRLLMPQGITPADLDQRLPWIAQHAIAKGYTVTDRLHIRIWGGEKRGV